jgi:hypothetical protein
MINQHDADLLVRIHIDGQPLESHDPATGAALYGLAGIPHSRYLFREVAGDAEDEPIEPTDQPIHLQPDDHFYSQTAFKVWVLYNGVKKPFEVRPEETVKRLLEEAIRIFGAANPHTLSLFKGGTELPDGQTFKEAGVKPHDLLLLRPGAVKGG